MTSQSAFGARLGARAAEFGVALASDHLQQFETYYKLLAKWNPRINLTALELGPTPPSETMDRLFIEPAIAAQLIPPESTTAVDLGSGAGSPAIPLKILQPELSVALIEARSRKVAFLREAIRTLGLRNVVIHQARFQELPGQAWADIATVRALRVDDELLAMVSRLLTPDGVLVLFGSSEAPQGWEVLDRLDLPAGSSVISCRRRG